MIKQANLEAVRDYTVQLPVLLNYDAVTVIFMLIYESKNC